MGIPGNFENPRTYAEKVNSVTSAVREEMRTRMWHLAVDDPRLYRKPRGWRGGGDAGAARPE